MPYSPFEWLVLKLNIGAIMQNAVYVCERIYVDLYSNVYQPEKLIQQI